MATLDEARQIALALPGTSEKVSWGTLHWRVRDVGLAWTVRCARPTSRPWAATPRPEMITDAWLDRAPKTLRAAFLAEPGEPRVPPA